MSVPGRKVAVAFQPPRSMESRLLRRVSQAPKSSCTKSTFIPACFIASETTTQSVLVAELFAAVRKTTRSPL
jgi:hypothetical protein